MVTPTKSNYTYRGTFNMIVYKYTTFHEFSYVYSYVANYHSYHFFNSNLKIVVILNKFSGGVVKIWQQLHGNRLDFHVLLLVSPNSAEFCATLLTTVAVGGIVNTCNPQFI